MLNKNNANLFADEHKDGLDIRFLSFCRLVDMLKSLNTYPLKIRTKRKMFYQPTA